MFEHFEYLGEKKIYVHGYSELLINQVKGVYQTKHPRMRAYRNLVLDLLENFSEYKILVVPREKNPIAYALPISTSVFKIPIYPNKKYEIEVKHMPSILDNAKYWQLFENDKKIIKFLQMEEEYENIQIDEDNLYDKDEYSYTVSVSYGCVNQIVGK
jgi:hypothetical protein